MDTHTHKNPTRNIICLKKFKAEINIYRNVCENYKLYKDDALLLSDCTEPYAPPENDLEREGIMFKNASDILRRILVITGSVALREMCGWKSKLASSTVCLFLW